MRGKDKTAMQPRLCLTFVWPVGCVSSQKQLYCADIKMSQPVRPSRPFNQKVFIPLEQCNSSRSPFEEREGGGTIVVSLDL